MTWAVNLGGDRLASAVSYYRYCYCLLPLTGLMTSSLLYMRILTCKFWFKNYFNGCLCGDTCMHHWTSLLYYCAGYDSLLCLSMYAVNRWLLFCSTILVRLPHPLYMWPFSLPPSFPPSLPPSLSQYSSYSTGRFLHVLVEMELSSLHSLQHPVWHTAEDKLQWYRNIKWWWLR